MADHIFLTQPFYLGKKLAWDSVIAESHADVTVVNTTTETDSVALTLPGGTVAVGDVLRLDTWIEGLNNSGAAATYNFRLKLGATTIITTGAMTSSTNVSRFSMHIEAFLLCESISAQRAKLFAVRSSNPPAWNTGNPSTVLYGTSAEDTSTDKILKLTTTLSVAATTIDLVTHGAALSILRKR